MDDATLGAIYDVVVQECGARESERPDFVQQSKFGTPDSCREWRFCGALGFGGKLRDRRFTYDGLPRFYVDCYREDETPERRKMIDAANARLAGWKGAIQP